ncbi:MAG TPA: hypothetical protein VL981_14865 [Candidatus Methylacidiphilales bacterium]|nr:hypothetical protein [Candidatus Methylacidiphilales bacterium]
MTRGIYLVTNRRSEREAAHLIFTLRKAGCKLPVALIPYDDDLPVHPRLRAETAFLHVKDFPEKGRALLGQIAELWPESRAGLFRRLLAWWGPFDEFIYSDNDIVALADWSLFLDRLGEHDFLHADEEYTTGGVYAYKKPGVVLEKFGSGALDSLLTTGFYATRKKPEITAAFASTVAWLHANPGVAHEVDGAFIHLAVLVGGLRIRNMCRAPDHWPSPWAGAYYNALELVQLSQTGRPLIHIHFAGWDADGYAASEELYFSEDTNVQRMRRHIWVAFAHWSGLHYLRTRIWRGLKRRARRILP